MIRRLVSETNSSSTHSLEIGSGYLIDSSDLNLNEDKKYFIPGDFPEVFNVNIKGKNFIIL